MLASFVVARPATYELHDVCAVLKESAALLLQERRVLNENELQCPLP